MSENEGARERLVVRNWAEWFEAVGAHVGEVERYEHDVRTYHERRDELQLFGRPHKRGFWRADRAVPASRVVPTIRFAFIGLALGLAAQVAHVALVTHEPVVTDMVMCAVAGLIAGAVVGLVPTLVRRLLLTSRMAREEEALAPLLSLIPQQYRNAQCLTWFKEGYEAYGYRDFDSCAREVDRLRQANAKTYRNVQLMVDVPYDGSGVDKIRRVAGAHSKNDPNLPADIERHTHAAPDAWREELDGLIGLDDVKSQVRRLENRVRVHGGSGAAVIGGNNMVLMGPAGVGKTSVARILTGMLAEAGIIAERRIVEVDGDYLKDSKVGGTGKRVEAICEWAAGGVLFVDEAYLLFDEKSGAGREATGVLLKYMEDHSQDLVIMFAGYTDDMERLIASNDGFRSRVRHKLYFSEYTAHELALICEKFLHGAGLTLEPGVVTTVERVFSSEAKTPGFGGAREARNAADALIDLQSDRVAASGGDARTITGADAEAWARSRALELDQVRHSYVATANIDESIVSSSELEGRTHTVEQTSDELLAHLVGQDGAKAELAAWKAKTAMLGAAQGNANVALLGPAGVGKTTFAEVCARVLFEAGRIAEPRVLDVTGDWFRANYVGQTGTRTEAAVQWARGGVLFIDEAYMMVDSAGSDFGSQAMGTLVNDMEKMDDLVVIVAGYTEEMQAFFTQNPGMASRIGTHIHLAPYTTRELMLIWQRMARAQGMRLARDVYRVAQAPVERHARERDFGQARAMKRLLEACISEHALRWSADNTLDRHLIDAEDVSRALTKLGW